MKLELTTTAEDVWQSLQQRCVWKLTNTASALVRMLLTEIDELEAEVVDKGKNQDIHEQERFALISELGDVYLLTIQLARLISIDVQSLPSSQESFIPPSVSNYETAVKKLKREARLLKRFVPVQGMLDNPDIAIGSIDAIFILIHSLSQEFSINPDEAVKMKLQRNDEKYPIEIMNDPEYLKDPELARTLCLQRWQEQGGDGAFFLRYSATKYELSEMQSLNEKPKQRSRKRN